MLSLAVKRTQIQLDEATYEALRRQAHEERRSVAALIRDAIHRSQASPSSPARPDVFHFVGIGRSPRRPRHPVSEHHDAVLADAFTARRPRRRP